MNFKSLFFFLPFFLQAYSISSTDVEYDGKKTLLKGNVSLVHEDLKAQADEAILELESGPYHLKKASLDGHVLFKLAKHGIIFCDQSLLDFETRKGFLNMHKGKIRYQGNVYFNHTNYPILCECDRSEFDLSDESCHPITIAQLRLLGHLKTTIHHQYTLEADQAVIEFERNSELLFPKSLELIEPNENLHLLFPYGQLWTNFLKFLFRNEEILIGKTKGILQILGNSDFICDQISYFHAKKIAIVKGPVVIQNPLQGHFKTNSNLEIHDFKPEEGFQFHKINIQGGFSLNYQGHQIDSNKGGQINSSTREISVNSKDEDCKINYQFQDIEIRSHHLKITYKENLENIDLIQFFGETWISLKNPIQNVQQIVCSKISFYPLENKIVIEANPNEKVLFWTKEEDLAMTTEGIIIILDENSHLKTCEFIGITKALIQRQIPTNFLKM